MEFKPDKTAAIDQFAETPRRASSCGCLGVGCLVAIIMMVLMCVGSYYTMMHTSLPLVFIKQALESDGKVRVKGLQGSISSGFEIEQLTFASNVPGHWDELRGIKFDFNGLYDLMRNERLIIHEATIDGATFYARFEGSGPDDDDVPQVSWHAADDSVANGINEGMEDFRREMESEDWSDLQEFRIDLVAVKDIRIVDPGQDEQLAFDNIEFSKFIMRDGELVSMGNIKVASDILDMTSSRSTRYPDDKYSWHFDGQIKGPMHKYIIKDVPFEVDMALLGGNRLALTASLCEGAVELVDPWQDKLTVRMHDWSPADYLNLTTRLVPTNWNATLAFETTQPGARPKAGVNQEPGKPADQRAPDTVSGKQAGGKQAGREHEADKQADKQGDQEGAAESDKRVVRTVVVEPDGSFVLGKTRFAIQPGRESSRRGSATWPALQARGTLEELEISARVTLHNRFPLVYVQLEAGETSSQDIWARLFFGKPWAELNEAGQTEVSRALLPPVAGLPEPVDF